MINEFIDEFNCKNIYSLATINEENFGVNSKCMILESLNKVYAGCFQYQCQSYGILVEINGQNIICE